VFLVASISTSALIGVFALSDRAVSLVAVAVAGIAVFLVSLFPVALALASRLVPPAPTGAAAGVVFGISGLMTAAAQPAVGFLAESVGDIRTALAWQLPLALLGIALATQIEDTAVHAGAVINASP
jgi:MFS family permease